MKVVAYRYSDPLLDPPEETIDWGRTVDRVYHDLGDRQEWEQLLQDCQENPPETILIKRWGDLGESLEEVRSAIAQLETLGADILTLEEENSNHQQLFRFVESLHQEQRSRKLRQGHARSRLNAHPPPGKAPYGYRRGKERYIIDRSTAPVVKDFFEHFLLYGSLRGAVRYLERRYGKKISVTSGRRWLTNPVYRGDLGYKDGDVIPNTHVPILTRDEAAQIDRLLRRNRQLPPRTASAPRSLAGLVVCQTCQCPLRITQVTTHRKKREYLYLRPQNCPYSPQCQAIPYEQLLNRTIERVCEDLPKAVSQMQSQGLAKEKPALQAKIQDLQDILTQISQLETHGVLDPETAQLRRYKLRVEIGKYQAQIAQCPPDNLSAIAQAVSFPQFWRDLSESERRFYFREFIQQIEIHYETRSQWDLNLVFFI
ncbi:MAG: recombinase family protein [Cyanobacteria bacterium]|jgi:DNA invertase Pin-like site-specific DNA recombinase|nr:recombinase family protein [Cyanobacteria bacterium GSL.Bin1]